MTRPDLTDLLDSLWNRLHEQGFSTTDVPGKAGSSAGDARTEAPPETGPDFGQVLTRTKLEDYLESVESTPYELELDPGIIVTPAARECAADHDLELRPAQGETR